MFLYSKCQSSIFLSPDWTKAHNVPVPLTYNRAGLLDQYFLPDHEVMRGQLNVTNTDEY